MGKNYLVMVKSTLLVLGVLIAAISARPYIVGVDISWVQEEEYSGVKYFDDGVQKDLFQIMKDHGVNFVRWRAFVNPCGPDGYANLTWYRAPGKECWCDLKHGIAYAKRVKAAGMGLLYDFHMSDTWASIGYQYVPAAWAGMSDADMQKAAYAHVKEHLEALIAQGLRPDMVQVGNEINSKMSGVSMSNPDRFTALINAGVKAVRDVDPTIKVAMHHGQPRPEKGFAAWYNLMNSKVDFDFIGGSTYGTTNNGQDWRDMFGLAVKNGQGVLSMEYTAQLGPLINDVMAEFPNNLGLGTFVWEPTNYPQDNAKYRMFTQNGNIYTTNANLDQLLNLSKKHNATLPDWVQISSGKQFSVQTSAGPGGTVSVTPATSKVGEGKKVDFTALPLEGWKFSGWTGDHTGSENPYTISSLAKDFSLNATFTFVATDSSSYEGENTKMTSGVVEKEHTGFSGTGYVNFDNAIGSSVEFDVVVAAAGEKYITITYANGAMDERPVSISVNGKVVVEEFGFTPLENWDTWSTHDVKVQLASGVNTITMTSVTMNGGPNIDFISFREATVRSIMPEGTLSYSVDYDPSSYTLTLSPHNAVIKLYAINGALVYKKNVNTNHRQFRMPVESFQKGLYLLKVSYKGSNHSSTFKLIKQ